MHATVVRNTLYYMVKPWLPRKFRLAIRRAYSHRQRVRARQIWPILPGSEKPPPGWSGWPQGKQFAVVLTHDVESAVGLNKCRQLMALENELGFRSSFNFIPEGSYRVSAKFRAELERSGFEVGVHDLHHDGKLYSSYREFLKRAERINYYLDAWGAVGFRSGYMLHNLEWAHKLNLLYEASTFDTDPFEPQPEGVGTVFPFWVPRSHAETSAPGSTQFGVGKTPGGGSAALSDNGAGYVELPYTLVQDSTLFLMLEERKPDIWFQKIDWLAENGGMVLVNVHPDYMAFDTPVQESWEYPSRLYEMLLRYIRSKYAGAYCHLTAAELARWYRSRLNSVAEVRASSQTSDRARSLMG
jgi:hypothetical protein